MNRDVFNDGVLPCGIFNGLQRLESVFIPRGCRVIQSGAFADCAALRRADIPATVEVIESRAFYNCPLLTDVYFDGSPEEWEKIDKRAGWDENAAICLIHFAKAIDKSGL